jgi:hypothetical protein
MRIPEPFTSIIVRRFAASRLETSVELRTFFNGCFSDIIEAEKITTNYQKRAGTTGDMFEYAFWHLVKHKYQFDMESDIDIPAAGMSRGGELDFGIFTKDVRRVPDNLVAGIEAKGSDPESSVRPALMRTDTMKKAIAQAYQFKRVYPKKPFFVVTNVLPTTGNAHKMMELAEGDIIDKFVDVTDINALSAFIEKIKAFE